MFRIFGLDSKDIRKRPGKILQIILIERRFIFKGQAFVSQKGKKMWFRNNAKSWFL